VAVAVPVAIMDQVAVVLVDLPQVYLGLDNEVGMDFLV
jgi:hypothetical protein